MSWPRCSPVTSVLQPRADEKPGDMMDHAMERRNTAAWRQPPILGATVLWLTGLGVLASNPQPNLQLPILSGALFGGLFSWLACRLTRDVARPTVKVADPRRSLMIQGVYLLI